MEFFRENGYTVALPEDPRFRSPSGQGGGSSSAVDGTSQLESFSTEIYDVRSFDGAIEILRASQVLLQAALERVEEFGASPSFAALPRYEVVLTLYGSGGSYDAESGTITMLTTPEGSFKGGGGAHTVVHEMVHMAVEESMVQRFGLSHWEKERLEDIICRSHFGDLLPDYQLQSQGVEALDGFIDRVSVENLAAAVGRYVAESRSAENP